VLRPGSGSDESGSFWLDPNPRRAMSVQVLFQPRNQIRIRVVAKSVGFKNFTIMDALYTVHSTLQYGS
jgi:hypothetical protein